MIGRRVCLVILAALGLVLYYRELAFEHLPNFADITEGSRTLGLSTEHDAAPFELNPNFTEFSNRIFAKCHLPIFDPYHDNINSTFQNIDPTRGCDRNYTPATALQDGHIRIVDKWKENVEYCDVRCHYNDWHTGFSRGSPWRLDPGQQRKIECEFVHAICYKKTRRGRPDVADEYLHIQLIERDAPRKNAGPIQPPTGNFRPDVHIILLDSVAGTQTRRALPRTVEYLEKEMGAVFMHHMNRVADGSQPNGFAFLLGERLDDITRAFLGAEDLLAQSTFDENCKQYLDNRTFIFNEYERAGYKTMIQFDWGDVFTYPDCKGFKEQPATHDYRAIVSTMEKNKGLEKKLTGKCIEEWHLLLEHHAQFAAAYNNTGKFGLSWLVEISHNNAYALNHADPVFLKYFQDHAETFSNSFVIFMADHGVRYGPTLRRNFGQREMNNPLLMITVPKFLRENAQVMANLKAHSAKLVTHYDVYATLQDILKISHATNYTNFDYVEVLQPNPNNGTSLLRPLGRFEDRSCQTIPVTGDFCLCELNRTTKAEPSTYHEMAQVAVKTINDKLKLEGLESKCATLKLNVVDQVQVYDPEEETHLYEITFSTLPNRGKYKARIRQNPGYQAFGYPVRLNEYGRSADCVASEKPYMRPYCYCK
ncbi:unnamed protein product, partial [Mesorhabditis spiculigera]